jgi:hypothetical protein
VVFFFFLMWVLVFYVIMTQEVKNI